MTFDNPEIQTLMEELKRRLKNVRDREERVEQVQSQLDSEWNNLATVTNRINQARLDLSNKLESARSQICLLYTSPSPRDKRQSRMPSSA